MRTIADTMLSALLFVLAMMVLMTGLGLIRGPSSITLVVGILVVGIGIGLWWAGLMLAWRIAKHIFMPGVR